MAFDFNARSWQLWKHWGSGKLGLCVWFLWRIHSWQMQHLLQLWEKHFMAFQWCKWWTGLPLTCSEAEFILLLAFIVVECPDSHASVHVFIEGVKPSICVFVCIGWVRLVLLITADAIKCVWQRRNVSCAESIIANVNNYFSYCHSLLYNNISSRKYNNCKYHIYLNRINEK